MSLYGSPTPRAASNTVGALGGSGTTLTGPRKPFIRPRRLWCLIVGHDLYSVDLRGARRVSDCDRCDLHIEESPRGYVRSYGDGVARRG